MKLSAVFLFACSFFILYHSGLTLVCLSCQQSYTTSTACSNIRPKDMTETCEGPNVTCFVSKEDFQNGSMKIVRRGCWNGDFCRPYTLKGDLISCTSCTTDRCNDKIEYEPISPPQCPSSSK